MIIAITFLSERRHNSPEIRLRRFPLSSGKLTVCYGKRPCRIDLVGKSAIFMAMFNSYVKLPAGTSHIMSSEALGRKKKIQTASVQGFGDGPTPIDVDKTMP